MTKDQFAAWRAHMGMTKAAAGRALDTHANTITKMESGEVVISKRTELACMALAAKLDAARWPWE